MAFESLIQIEGQDEAEVRVKKHVISAKPKVSLVGCDHCPSKLNWKHGIKPIFGDIAGKKIFVWAQSPGPQENKQGKELIGPSGDWLWNELRAVGIKREDCDIQNVVRCFPADYQDIEWPPLKMRSPEKEEIKCCQKFNQEAVEKSKAKIHLVFGAVAHKALLGVEYKKARKVFYSPKLKGSVFLLDHPSYFLRAGFGGKGQQNVPTDRLKIFRRMLRDAAQVSQQEGPVGKYSYIKSRKYVPVESVKTALEAYRAIKAVRGTRVGVDCEHGYIEGVKTDLCWAFIIKPGVGYCYPTGVREISRKVSRVATRLVKKILANPDIKKVFHHGSSDAEEARELLDAEIRGYDYDTVYAEYFANPVGGEGGGYGLEAIGDRRFPKFGGWKEIILPDAFKEDWLAKRKLSPDKIKPSNYMKLYEAARKENGLNYGQIPWKKLWLRCLADADITKRIEITTKAKVNPPLMWLYKDSAFVLGRMEREGPLFDYQQLKQVRKLWPIRVASNLKAIRKLIKNPTFNPSSPPQISKLLFESLDLEYPFEGKRNTRKETLIAMAGLHPVVPMIRNYRIDKKVEGTYIDGFEACANINHGRLRTKWWLTGTSTGRLSSGGGKEKKTGDKSVVNLQNVHGDPALQNLLVSDPRWREIYKVWCENTTSHLKDKVWSYVGGFTEKTWQKFQDFKVFLGFDFAQMELRFIAEQAGDEEYMKMFMDPENDPHSMVGHALTGWSIEKIKTDDRIRRIVKAMHFGIVYGLKAPGLVANLAAQGVTVTLREMEGYIEKYFQRFKGVRRWLDRQMKRVEELGYTEDVFGHRRPINVDEQKQLGREWQGAYWGNQAVNTPIQGGAHKMMLVSVAALERKPETYNLLQHPQLEIHDALYFSIALKHLWDALKQGVDLLEREPIRIVKEHFGIDWKTPLKADGSAGFRFGVKVKDIGVKVKTIWEFLNAWCIKNRETQLKLQKEIQALA